MLLEMGGGGQEVREDDGRTARKMMMAVSRPSFPFLSYFHDTPFSSTHPILKAHKHIGMSACISIIAAELSQFK